MKEFVILAITLLVISHASPVYAEEFSVTTSTTTETIIPLNNYKVDYLPGTDTPIGDYVVGPGKLEVTVKPGQTATYFITVANRVAEGQLFSFSVEDMVGTNDGSRNVVLLGDDIGPYSIQSFVEVPNESVLIDLNTRVHIPVTITIPPNTDPGGYYGAVLVSTLRRSDAKDMSVAQTPLIARLGVLLFITVEGESVSQGTLTDFSTKNKQYFFSSGPITFLNVFENTGTVHLNPYGELRITNLLDEEVGLMILDPWFVLPNAVRTREVVWDRKFLFGRYIATVSINRGYDDIVDSKSVVLWVIPWYVPVGIITLFLFIVLFILLRRR